MSLEWFVYLLYITTLYVLFIVGKERFETTVDNKKEIRSSQNLHVNKPVQLLFSPNSH